MLTVSVVKMLFNVFRYDGGANTPYVIGDAGAPLLTPTDTLPLLILFHSHHLMYCTPDQS